ncbi:MAG: hypothetical protein ACI8P0_005397 [Planctomycetaceae bacterium]|jgi:hypothetical protein
MAESGFKLSNEAMTLTPQTSSGQPKLQFTLAGDFVIAGL